MIETTVQTNGTAQETGAYMRAMTERYKNDMLPYVHLPLIEVYNAIKSLPYRPDPVDREYLQRPSITMTRSGPGGDCDDKSIALAAYASLLAIPYRFVALRRAGRNTLHHVITQLYLNNSWISFDPTYSFNAYGRERGTYAERQVIG
jgi:transglutaminase-like putative cysteine protease